MAKKVAEQLVDMLVEAGVKRIYAATRKSEPMRLGRRLNYTGNWLVVPEVVVRDTFI